jgi:hypothetical protein
MSHPQPPHVPRAHPAPGARPRARATSIVLLIVATTLTAGHASAVAAPAEATRAPRLKQACTAGWRSMPVPKSAFRSTPFEIVARDGGPAWVLGGSDRGLLTLSWRDGAWMDVSPRGGGFRGLVAGLVSRAGDVVAAGYRRPATGRGLSPTAGTYGAAGWREEAVPSDPGEASLTAIAGRRGTVAVGSIVSRGRARAIAVRRARGGWRRQDLPVSRGESALAAMAEAPDGSLWAVGWQSGRAGRWRPLVLRRTRQGWARGRAPSLPVGSGVLADIAFGTDGRAWVAGFLVPTGSSAHVPVLARRDGDSWQSVPLPWAEGVSTVVRSVDIGDDGRVWLAGAFLATDAREARGFVAVRGDEGWSVGELATPSTVRSELHAVAALGDGAMAAGSVAWTSVVLETCPLEVATRKGRIKVGAMAARRAARALEDDDGAEPGTRRDAGAASLPRIGAAVDASGFEVRDVTRKAGLETRSRSYGGLVADFNGDGRMDVFYSRHGQITPRLYLGRKGGFELAPDTSFGIVDRHGCTASDADRSGTLDIFCTVGRGRGTALHRHELSLDPAGADPRLARGALGASDPFGRGRAATFIHLDGDRYPELFVTTLPDRVDGMPGPNRLFRNLGGRFVPAPELGLDRHVGGDCAVAADIDGDGDEDLLHCVSAPDDGRPGGLRIRRNESGRLPDRSRALGVAPIGDRDVLVADLTGDGRPDLVQLGSDRLRVSRGTRSGFVPRFEVRVRRGVALGAGDADGDGYPDLYVVTAGPGNWPDHLLLNRRKGRAFVSVRIPQAADGGGDDVLVLDYDQNGLADFLVLNGLPRSGPVQLLASFRR